MNDQQIKRFRTELRRHAFGDAEIRLIEAAYNIAKPDIDWISLPRLRQRLGIGSHTTMDAIVDEQKWDVWRIKPGGPRRVRIGDVEAYVRQRIKAES